MPNGKGELGLLPLLILYRSRPASGLSIRNLILMRLPALS